jgi:hypothetical protein
MYLESELNEIEARELLKYSQQFNRRIRQGLREMFADDMPERRDPKEVYRPPQVQEKARD